MTRTTDEYFKKFAQWHHDRNLIDGATNETQFVKLMEEVLELYATLNPDKGAVQITSDIVHIAHNLLAKGRVSQAPEGKTIEDDLGDINVVLVNLAERAGVTMVNSMAVAWDDIKDRKGKMIDGVFVKEADL